MGHVARNGEVGPEHLEAATETFPALEGVGFTGHQAVPECRRQTAGCNLALHINVKRSCALRAGIQIRPGFDF